VRRTSHAQRPTDGAVCTTVVSETHAPPNPARLRRVVQAAGMAHARVPGWPWGYNCARAQGDLDGALVLLELAGQSAHCLMAASYPARESGRRRTRGSL